MARTRNRSRHEPNNPLIAAMVERRIELDMTLEDVSHKSGYTVRSIAGYEREDSMPNMQTFIDWAGALELVVYVKPSGKRDTTNG